MKTWKTIPSFPHLEASDDGEIRNIKTKKLLIQALTFNGYFCIGTSKGTRSAARLICEAFHGACPKNKEQAAHWNGIRTDNRPENLRWVTRRENYKDQIRHGTSKKGDGHHNVKLTTQKILEIRKLAKTMKQREIAKIYNTCESNISGIVNRNKWKHL